jgi:hypothetical protein
MMTELEQARNAFIGFLADAKELSIDYDADQNDSGRMVDCSTFTIQGDLNILLTLMHDLGFHFNREEGVEQCIDRYIEAEGANG